MATDPTALLTNGAPDEIFVLGALSWEIDIATLITRINATPIEEIDIREDATSTLIELAKENYVSPRIDVSKSRMEEPVLLLPLRLDGKRQFVIIDGTHRLHARAAAGKPKTKYVVIKFAMLEGLIRQHERPW